MRFIDLFLYHGTPDAPEWHGIDQGIPEMIEYRVKKLPTGNRYTPRPIELTSQTVTMGDAEGYCALSMPLRWVIDKTVDADLSRLIQWTCGAAEKGKIRINMHGDGKGHGLMMNSQVRGKAVAKWLCANGLVSPAGGSELVIALPICWCARNVFNTKGLTQIGTDRSDTKISLMTELHNELRSRNLHRIKITGAPDMIEMGKRKWARATSIPGPWQTELDAGLGGHVVKLYPGTNLGTLTYKDAVPGANRDGFRLNQVTAVGIQGDQYQLTLSGGTGATLPTSGWQIFQDKPAFKARRWYLAPTVRNAQVVRVNGGASCFEVVVSQLPSLRLTAQGKVTGFRLYGVGAKLVTDEDILVTPPDWYYHIEIDDIAHTVEIELRPPKAAFAFEAATDTTPARFKIKYPKKADTVQNNTAFPGTTMNILKVDREAGPILLPVDGFTCTENGNDIYVTADIGTVEEDETGPLVKLLAKRLRIATGQHLGRILIPITDNQKAERWLN